MLSRPLPPDLSYPPYAHPQPPQPSAYPSTYHPLSMDPTSVDFRAFYPYTPNEVKHRKRTTAAQLQKLESVFKRDTKPNGPLRVDLATQLGMTARGVQVWFQNRRAKEKIKAGKIAKVLPNSAKDDTALTDASPSPKDTTSSPDSPQAHQKSSRVELTDNGESSSQSSSPAVPSSPRLDSHALWHDASVDDVLTDQPNLHAYRRGSLPVNVFPPAHHSANGPPSLDSFDPYARRLSVDASLQRLASNPYAPLARAKNGVIFGPRATSGRYRQASRVSYGPHSHRSVPSNASMPYRLDIRRASMDSRGFRLSPRSAASPSPSPLSPHNGARGSLPDHHLYAVTSRSVPSPIPGPLPSPNFSFGAASTPSMASTSSGDSERNSPDSLQSLLYRGDEWDEDDGTSYNHLTRFGSFTSVATSDSSINSGHYPDITGYAVDQEHTDVDYSTRRDSCAPGFLTLMSDLDVNGMHETIMNPLDHGVYGNHDDVNAADVIRVDRNGGCIETNTYPSPTSTISPGIAGSPQAQNASPSPVPVPVPISRSSELAFALQSQTDQIQTNPIPERTDKTGYTSRPIVELEVTQPPDQYFYTPETDNSQLANPSNTPMEYTHYSADNIPIASHDHFEPSTYLTDGYAVGVQGDINTQRPHPHITFEHHTPTPEVYNAYGEVVAPLEGAVQTVETYVTYN